MKGARDLFLQRFETFRTSPWFQDLVALNDYLWELDAPDEMRLALESVLVALAQAKNAEMRYSAPLGINECWQGHHISQLALSGSDKTCLTCQQEEAERRQREAARNFTRLWAWLWMTTEEKKEHERRTHVELRITLNGLLFRDVQ